MRVEVSRRGGIIGGRPLKGTLDTGELPVDDARAAEDAVRALPFGRTAPPPPTRPDLMQYGLTMIGADGQMQTVEVNEDELSDELRRLIDPTLHIERPA